MRGAENLIYDEDIRNLKNSYINVMVSSGLGRSELIFFYNKKRKTKDLFPKSFYYFYLFKFSNDN